MQNVFGQDRDPVHVVQPLAGVTGPTGPHLIRVQRHDARRVSALVTVDDLAVKVAAQHEAVHDLGDPVLEDTVRPRIDDELWWRVDLDAGFVFRPFQRGERQG